VTRVESPGGFCQQACVCILGETESSIKASIVPRGSQGIRQDGLADPSVGVAVPVEGAGESESRSRGPRRGAGESKS
jgi:hypothetical protein